MRFRIMETGWIVEMYLREMGNVAPDIGNEPHDSANQLMGIGNALLPFETGQP
jgi:hypothetical protein